MRPCLLVCIVRCTFWVTYRHYSFTYIWRDWCYKAKCFRKTILKILFRGSGIRTSLSHLLSHMWSCSTPITHDFTPFSMHQISLWYHFHLLLKYQHQIGYINSISNCFRCTYETHTTNSKGDSLCLQERHWKSFMETISGKAVDWRVCMEIQDLPRVWWYLLALITTEAYIDFLCCSIYL